MPFVSAKIFSEKLESRVLLAGAGTDLIATLSGSGGVAVSFNSSAVLGEKIFLAGHRNSEVERLWVSSESSDIPDLLFTATQPSSNDGLGITEMTPLRGKMLFFANSVNGDCLFSSDGTVAGTHVLQLLRGGGQPLPTQSAVLNDRLYFFTVSDTQAVALWSSDGTEAGTVLVWTAPAGTSVQSMSAPINNQIFFGGNGQLWRTDGTAAGTSAVWSGGLPANSYPSAFAVAGQKLFFIAIRGQQSPTLHSANLDGSNVQGITVPAGNESAPTIVSRELTVVGDRVLFVSRTGQSRVDQLFASDGTDSGTVQVGGATPSNLQTKVSPAFAAGAGKAVFIQTAPGAAITGVFATDGTVAGTERILAKRLDSIQTLVFSAHGRAFINLVTPGLHFYESDGTSKGTRELQYLPGPRIGTSTPRLLATLDQNIIVHAMDYDTGFPLVYSLDPQIATGSITGLAYTDHNRNGSRDAFEPLFPGNAYVDINENSIFEAGEAVSAVDSNEGYRFGGLPPDRYVVRFTPANGVTTPQNATHVIDLSPSQQIVGADFVATNNSTVVWGKLYNDVNGDGTLGAQDLGLELQTLYLDYNGNLRKDLGEPTARSASDGSYGFIDPLAGTYTVRVEENPGWLQTVPANRAGREVTVTAGAVVQLSPFAVTVMPAGSLVGTIWNDWNQDAVRDSGDTPASNAFVYLDLNNDGIRSDGEPVPASSAQGRYTVSNLVPGQYTIRTVLFSTLTQTLPAKNAARTVIVPSNGVAIVEDFLIFDPSATAPTGRISGSVWSDRNGNGSHDPDELNAIGVIVYADLNANGLFDPFDRWAQTDATGSYSFPNSPAGSYVFRVSLPAKWTQTAPTATPYYARTLTNGQQLQLPEFGVRSSDVVAPVLLGKFLHAANAVEARFGFNEAIALTAGGMPPIVVDSLTRNAVPTESLHVVADGSEIVFRSPTLAGERLPAGIYRASIPSANVRDYAGNVLQSAVTFSFAVAGGGEVINVPASTGVQRIEALSLASNATIDLANNNLIIDYDGATQLGAIQSLINSARANDWSGFGITSSAARNNPNRTTTLGAMEASDWKALPGNAAALFDGEVVDGSAVLIKYTYYGDADFNGRVNFDDYARTDRGFNERRTGWINGDYNGDGVVNFDDYTLIDRAFNSPGPQLRPPPAGISPIAGPSRALR